MVVKRKLWSRHVKDKKKVAAVDTKSNFHHCQLFAWTGRKEMGEERNEKKEHCEKEKNVG